MSTIGPYSFEQYLKMVEDFHGRVAPGMVTGGFMIDFARRNLPEGAFFDAISETTSCLPDTIQLLTPCTIGNGWLRVIDTGRFALTLFEKYGGEGVRVSLDVEKLEGWPEIKAWFLKLTPKSEQDTKRLLEELQEAGSSIYRVEHVRVAARYLGKQKKSNIRLCARCRELFRSDTEDICPFCTGEKTYLSPAKGEEPAGVWQESPSEPFIHRDARMLYEQLRNTFIKIAGDHGLLDEAVVIESSVLTPAEAIGSPNRKDFPLQKGREFLMQAEFMGSEGQAYTDSPSRFRGSIQEIADLELSNPGQKALFIAALNAVARHVHPDLRTLHCKNEGPELCARKIAEYVQDLGPQSVGMIGLQPAILEALVGAMGKDRVRCIDRDEENQGQVKYGISIEWGDDRGLKHLFEKSDLVLATGSSVANGSLPGILSLSADTGTPVYFYGTTIAGTARLMALNHLCYESR